MADSRLAKWPAALLELLRLRNTGDAPTRFVDTVQTVVVANDHYGADLQFTSNDQGSAGAMPRGLTGTVGAGQAAPGPVRLLGFSCAFTMGANAGTRLILRLSIRQPGNTSPGCFVGDRQFTAGLAAGETYVCSWVSPTPLILLPGAGLRADATGDQSGADHVLALRTIVQVLNTG